MPEQKKNIISLTNEELENLFERASQEGARKALAELGLHDEKAGADIKDLRALIGSYRFIKIAVWKTLLDKLITFVVLCFLAGLAVKCGLSLDKFK